MNILRHARIAALVALGLLVGAIGGALGQAGWNQIVSPAGTEMLQAFVASSAYQNFVSVNQVRNSTGYQLLVAASGTISPTNAVDSLLINAQPAASTTINTPASPYDAELFQVCNVSNAAWVTNLVTLAAASGSSLNTGTVTVLTTLGARTCEELQFDLATATWYQIR